MNTFIVNKFSAAVNCKFEFVGEIYGICNDFSYTFHDGVYALSGEITDGGWTFSYALTDIKKNILFYDQAEYFFNNSRLTLQEIQKLTHYVGYIPKRTFPNKWVNQSIHKYIKEGIIKNKLKYTPSQIRDMFYISESRFEREQLYSGIQTFLTSAAVGFVNSKKIFCFPWLNKKFILDYHDLFKQMFSVLKSNECIVLVPITEISNIEDMFDQEVNIYRNFMEKNK